MPSKMTEAEFLRKLKNSHEGKVVRIGPKYTNSDAKHEVRCTICKHEWIARGYTLTKKRPNGCPKCGREVTKSKLTCSLDEFLVRLRRISPTIAYLSGYTRLGANANFKCLLCKHEFKYGCMGLVGNKEKTCPACYKRQPRKKRSTEDFIKMVRECHGNSIKVLGKYVLPKHPIKVECCLCGHKWSPYADSLVGVRPHGCPNCKTEMLRIRSTKPRSVFEAELKKAHKGHITLISEYKKQTSNLQFRCSQGHTWWTKYGEALIKSNPYGCPQCGHIVSRAENELYKWVLKAFPDAVQSVRKIKDPETGGSLEWDIYIPSKNIAIEYNGIYYHSWPKKPKDYHYKKTRISKKNGVRLIHINEIEWKTQKKLVKKTLRHILGITKERYFARKLNVNIKTKMGPARRSFYEKNHLQGSPRKGISCALLDNNRAIRALMTFCPIQSVRGKKAIKGEYELIRYATKGLVVGGASRCLAAFIKKYQPTKVMSYSQNDWFTGDVYSQLGFTKVADVPPSYQTIWDKRLRHKSYTKRKNLAKLLGDNFDPEVSEMENLRLNEIPVLFDSGKIKWELNLSS